MEYNGQIDADYSYLPGDFFEDEIMLDKNGDPCYICGKPSQFYNLTVQRNECEEHTKSKERDLV